jgi:acetyl-CoA acetyltransferase
VVAVCGAGVDPADPLRAPQAAAAAALERAGLSADRVDAWSVAATHAAVAFDLTAALGLDPERLDPEGGVLARGHAGAATGLVELVDLLDHLDDIEGRFGLVVETAPDGLATAAIVDREVWA